MKDQATQVFEAFKAVGVNIRALAFLLDAHPTTLYKWAKPAVVGGTGGYVPAQWWSDLLRLADERGVKIDLDALLRGETRNPRRKRRSGKVEDIFA